MPVKALNRVNAQAHADQHEDTLAAAYEQVLNTAGRKAASRFRALAPLTAAASPDPKQPNWAPPNIDELIDLALVAEQTAKQTGTIRLQALAAVLNAYGETLKQVTAPAIGEPAFDVTNPAALTLLDQHGARAGDVAKSVRDDLQKIIGDAYTAGLSVNNTADQIVALSDQFSKAQARMLARSDLNGLANGGANIAAKEVFGEDGGFKTWLATDDEKTRETHAEADGQTVPVDEQFQVGGEFADYPGDPQLSDAEAANCRCSLYFSETVGDAENDLAAAGAIPLPKGGATVAQITIPLEIRVGEALAGASDGFTPVIRASREELDAIRIMPSTEPFATFGASGDTGLPLSERDRPWSAGAAGSRVKRWASSDGSGDPSKIDYAKLARAYFWQDAPGPDGPALGDFKLPFADVIGGELTAIWSGVTAGAARLTQTQGIDQGAVQAKMGAYYRAAAKKYKDDQIKTPWAAAVEPDADDMARHAFLDDGTGSCAFCGMSAGAAIHSAPSEDVIAAAPSPTWRAVLCVEGEPTEDGRLLEPGSISWRELPLTLLCQLETAAGHDGAEVCGRIDRIWREGAAIMGEGVFDSGAFGLEAARLVRDETLRGVSVDLAVLEYEIRAAPDADDQALYIADGIAVQDDPDELFVVTDGVIGAATICAFQAIAQATIEVLTAAGPFRMARITTPLALETLVASIIEAEPPLRPPAAWFDDPGLDRPTLVTVTEDGRVFGHVAPWRGCHTGYSGRCVPPPRSRTGYAGFHVGRVETAEGDLLPIGRLTLAAPHADINASSESARRHYDNTASVAAYVRAGEDAHGVWVAGALRPGIEPAMVQELLANPLSGDWRNGEMVAAHAVPVPGFPILQASAIGDSGEEETALILTSTVALVAAGEAEAVLPVRAKVLAARARGGLAALAELARS